MARLIAKPLYDELLPVEAEGTRLEGVELGPVTSIAPLEGGEKAVVEALKPLGLGFPGPGETIAKDGARIVWTGRGQAFLIGADPPDMGGSAALTHQSDGWAALRLSGPKAEAALARLVPLDLRAVAFPEGRTARTMLFHMTCSITRVGPEAFEIMVMRSMLRTAVHDLGVAMRSVAAQT